MFVSSVFFTDGTYDIRAHSASRYDVLFTLAVSAFNSDVPHIELRIVDIRPA